MKRYIAQQKRYSFLLLFLIFILQSNISNYSNLLYLYIVYEINRNLDRHNDAFKHLQGFCWKRIWCCYASYQHGSLYFHLI